MAKSRRPQTNPIVVSGLMRRGLNPSSRLDRVRGEVYWQELAPSAALMAALLALAGLARRPRLFALGLAVLTGVDLLWLGRVRDLDFGPITSMTSQSPVLGLLQDQPRGTRTIDPLGNLAMRSGADPVRAYRTLDLPTLPDLTGLVSSPWPPDGPSNEVLVAMRAIGARVRILDPFSVSGIDREALLAQGFSVRSVDDPALTGWLYGVRWARAGRPGATTFVLASQAEVTQRAWMIDKNGVEVVTSTANPMPLGDVLRVLDGASAVSLRKRETGGIEVGPIDVSEGETGGLVVIPVQHDPQWRGVWKSESRSVTAEAVRAFPVGAGGGWLSARIPGPGTWTLSWVYEPRSERMGQWIAGPAWGVWGVALMASFWTRRGRIEVGKSSQKSDEGVES